MFGQLFRLATREPETLANHVEAYAELIAAEVHTAASRWRRQAVLTAIGYASFFVTALLIAVALMLWAVIPVTAMNKPWVLLIVPLLPAIVGTWAASAARTNTSAETFLVLRDQWAADRQMFRELHET